MSQLADWLLWELGRTSLWLALAGVSACLILRVTRVTSPTLNRLAWCVALVAGWSFVRLPLDVPWYRAAPLAATIAEQPPMPAPSVIELAPAEVAPFVDEPAPGIASSMPESVELPAAAPPTASPWLIGWQELLLVVWGAGILSLSASWLIGYAGFVWRLPATLEGEAGWHDQWVALLSSAGVTRQIPLHVTAQLGPLLCRLPRGHALLVPEPLWHRLDAAERRAILRHELAHFRRGDLWKSFAVRVLALPHWFNPVSWWAVRSFDEAAEWDCDRAAAEDEPAAYAKTLMRAGELVAPRARYGTALRGRPLATRIRRLITLNHQEDSTMKRALILIVAAGLVAAALVRVQLVAQEPEPANTTREASPPATQRAEPPRNTKREASPAVKPAEQNVDLPVCYVLVHDLDREIINSAKHAYKAAKAAFDSGTITLDRVHFWSGRWFAAELSAARTKDERVAAATAHLERVEQLQTNIKALFDVGARGGEALDMAAANFYVAEAKRDLARQHNDKPANARGAQTSNPRYTIDTATKFATVGPVDSSQRVMRFQGRTFDEWKGELENEIAPTSRMTALGVLGEFAANGRGAEVAELTMDLMRGYACPRDSQHGVAVQAFSAMKKVPPEQLLPVVLKALSGNIPPEAAPGADPVQAVHQRNMNQRLFAISLLPYATPEPADAVPYLLQNLTDADLRVRDVARYYAAVLAYQSPETVEMLRSGLKHPNRDDVLATIKIIGGSPMVPVELRADWRPYFSLAPELIELLGHKDSRIVYAAKESLRNMGSEVNGLLQKAKESSNPEISVQALDALAPRYAPAAPSSYPPVPYSAAPAPFSPYAAPPQTYAPSK